MKYSRSFAGRPASVGAARNFATEIVVDAPRETLDAIVLMVSELATNCVRFSVGDFTVNIEHGHRIHVEVTDGGGGMPTLGSPRPEDPSGRGLLIVQEMSDQWGIASAMPCSGKTVWFTVTPNSVG
jgi:anti-sigma regulatory factor (Ser/Thr protein kinase)